MTITSKQITISDAMKSRINSCIKKLKKLDNTMISNHVYISQEPNNFIIEAKFVFASGELFAKAKAEDFYKAMAKLANKLERQKLTKMSKKIRKGGQRQRYYQDEEAELEAEAA
ncbi:ribosome-associated translation inhibitor RaiA [Paraferrimonas sp. SM1919]|uniref:ribosome hibernation-promoting factor, HPF/YfiA family n=1 Tax=Paraferrimonas sp. SM1919 TaxID=2662263 RepID=UPI0013D09832|nr:ribosome-associated translation inhibitor RaiA [Paraferrimonas sp. SM1919]